MIFNTHSRTPKIKTDKKIKIMLIFCWCFIVAFYAFIVISLSIISQNIFPALIFTICFALALTFIIIPIIDMNKAFVQINGDNITVVDYYFGLKRKKEFKIQQIATAEIILGYSFRVKGYRYSRMGISYIVFKNEKNEYLFKIFNCPETYDFFIQAAGLAYH